MFFLPEPGLRPRLAGVRIRFARHWATSVCVGGQGEKGRRRKDGKEKGEKEKGRQKERKEERRIKDWEGGLISVMRPLLSTQSNTHTFLCPALASFHQSQVS